MPINKAAAKLGRKGGQSTSKIKRAAARENGKLGGRPVTKWEDGPATRWRDAIKRRLRGTSFGKNGKNDPGHAVRMELECLNNLPILDAEKVHSAIIAFDKSRQKDSQQFTPRT